MAFRGILCLCKLYDSSCVTYSMPFKDIINNNWSNKICPEGCPSKEVLLYKEQDTFKEDCKEIDLEWPNLFWKCWDRGNLRNSKMPIENICFTFGVF